MSHKILPKTTFIHTKNSSKHSGIQVCIFSLEIPTTTSDARKIINSWIQNNIIYETMTNQCSYRINPFKYFHLPKTALNNFIDGEINTDIFDCLKLW